MTAIQPRCDEGLAHGSTSDPSQCGPAAARAILIVTVLGSSMTFIDGSVVNVVLPLLRKALNATAAETQWIVEAYMLFLASLILLGGALGDRWGRRRVFVMGTVLFAVSSGACGAARSSWELIVARGVQGVGAALLVPGSLALISANFSRERRGRAIGTWASFTSIAAGMGPVLGAWLVERLSWRWIFFLNLPIAVAIVLIARSHVPESRAATRPAPLDIPGACLVTAGLFGIVLGLTEAGARGFGDRLVLVSLGTGAAALLAFVAVEWTTRDPMLPLALFRSATFSGTNLLTLLLYAGIGGMMFVLPFNLIEVRGYTIVQASSALLPFVVVMFAISRWAGGLMDKYGPRLPLTAGPLIAAAGFFLLGQLTAPSYWTGVLPAVMVMSIGMGMTVAPLTATVMASAGEDAAGLASGINNAVSRVATLMAVAAVGLLVDGGFGAGLPRVALLASALAALGGASAAVLVKRS